jgi:hypothetical protein
VSCYRLRKSVVAIVQSRREALWGRQFCLPTAFVPASPRPAGRNACPTLRLATFLPVLLLAQEPPIARVPVRLVIAPTSVTDQRGKFINGLGAPDFTLYDNDVPQQIHEDSDFLPISLAVAIQNNTAIEGFLRF